MADDAKEQQSALADAWRSCRGPLIHAAVFSAVVNLLMLTGPLFMMQVYDRVLTSHSVPTLVALFVLVTFLFALLMGLDLVRGRVLVATAGGLRERLDERVFAAGFRGPATTVGTLQALRELDAVERALSSPVAVAVMDLPWVPLFLLAIFALHPLLGGFAVAGALALAGVSAAQGWRAALAGRGAAEAQFQAEMTAREFVGAEAQIVPLGMRGAALARWQVHQAAARSAAARLAYGMAGFGAAGRAARLYLQSALLAAGAWLSLGGELSGGGMVAASVLFGRMLAPVEGLIAGWPTAARAVQARRWLKGFFKSSRNGSDRLALPRPRGTLTLQDVTVCHEGEERPALSQISLSLAPGRIVGLAGPTGSGKSTLLAVMAGSLVPEAGEVRLDGATLGQYAPDMLGAALGYLPQEPRLFPATVAENIARLAQAPEAAAVIEAARKAGAHEMILALPQGYETRVGTGGRGLSGGQTRRIALARALFGRPALLLLDEPDCGQDGDANDAIMRAIIDHRAEGGSVVLASHRVRMLALCDEIAVLDGGHIRQSGPRERVLATLSGTHRPGPGWHRGVA
ncbi:MAG TPA: type I secretion system permease/ATPase [Paracoccaceae bacterium]|nr:type I secretion system permease/ATPase [Paracoccaceae bacterium]